jgi:hypothetical protein
VEQSGPLIRNAFFSAMPYSDDAKLDGILSSAKDFDMPRQTARIDWSKNDPTLRSLSRIDKEVLRMLRSTVGSQNLRQEAYPTSDRAGALRKGILRRSKTNG